MSDPQKKSGSCLVKMFKIALLFVLVAIVASSACSCSTAIRRLARSDDQGLARRCAQLRSCKEWPNWLPFTAVIVDQDDGRSRPASASKFDGRGGTESTFTSSD